MRTVLILLVALMATACGAPSSSNGATIVVTTTVLGDFVRQIAGDAVTVGVLMPVGADPHEFEASAQQVAAMEKATLVVANGLGLEEGMTSVLDAVESDGVPVLKVGELEAPRDFSDGSPDPHVWFDPVRMADAANAVAAKLAEVAPGATDWTARGQAYAQEIQSTEEAMRGLFDQIPVDRRKLVTGHMAFGYLADRFGFSIVGVVIPGGGTMGAPSAGDLAALARTIIDEDVPAIFTETTESPTLADALAKEVGRDVKVVSLYTGSLGAPGSGADSYLGLLLTDAQTIAHALEEN
jgi:zinc/manganese transport system substrate-binding protein